MRPGETRRFDCTDCSREFEVTLEPKAKGGKAAGLKPALVYHCPFCGSEKLETDED